MLSAGLRFVRGRKLSGRTALMTTKTTAHLHFGTMTPRIVHIVAAPQPGAAPADAHRLPWDYRPESRPDPPLRFADALQLAREDATALAAALAEEDRITEERIRRRVAELEQPAGSAPGPAKRKLSLRMPPPGPTESFARIMAAWDEAPRKKRRVAFPPPTAHETRRVA